MKKAFWKNVILCVIGLAVIALLWTIAYWTVGNDYILPKIFPCLKESVLLLVKGEFWVAMFSTLWRVLLAFVVSLIFAVVFAVIAYLYPAFRQIFAPMVGGMRAVPVLGVLLLILKWTNSAIAPIVVACLSLFPILYAEILSALLGVDKDLIEMSNVYNVPLKKQIVHLYFPSALPHVLRSCGAAIGFGFKLVVSAEALVRTAKSLGGQMQDAQILSELPTLFALLIVACVMAFVLETVFARLSVWLERRGKCKA